MANIATEFNQKVARGARRIITERMNAMMVNAANNIMNSQPVQRLHNNEVFYNVTGNLYKSIASGAFYRGELIYMAGAPGEPPTRRTLKAGEVYDKPVYYSGREVGKRRYRAPKNSPSRGGQYGPDMAERTLDVIFTPRSYTWMLRVVAGVDYASYVQNVSRRDFMTDIREYVRRYYKRLGR